MNEMDPNHDLYANKEEADDARPLSHPQAGVAGIGIASFLLAILSLLGSAWTTARFLSTLRNAVGPDSGLAISEDELFAQLKPILGFLLLYPLLLLMSAAAFVLGIVALKKQPAKKGLPWIGALLSGLLLLFMMIFLIIGVIMAVTGEL